MKKYHLLLVMFLFLNPNISSQVGINTQTPTATLEIVEAPSSSYNNIVEVSDNSTSSLLNVDRQGNLNIYNTLMPNSLSGSTGDVLISQGANTPPIWKKSSIDHPTIEIFSAQRNELSSTVVAVREYRVLDFPNVNTLPITDIGSWNSTTNTFTVNKKGIFHISAGLDAVNMQSSTSNLALHISTSLRSQTASGLNYISEGKYNYSTNTTLSIILSPGHTIRLTGNSGSSSWQQGPSFISILFAELP